MQRMVSEIYSAPRVTKAMKLMPGLELVPGFALDLSGNDGEGNAWDFTRADMREKARMDSARDPATPCGGGAPYSLLLRGVQAAGGRRALLPSRAPRQRHLVAI